jgi:uncharacterized protein (TIGR02145 family)
MKRIISIYSLLLFMACLFAQAPDKLSYQAVVRNSGGQLVTNKMVGMKISILQGTPTGTIVYQETFNPNPETNANGLVIVEIGVGIPIMGTFSSINWSNGPYFIKTETDPTGGTDYTITGTSQLLSVPYALYAKTAENGFSGNYNDLTNKPALFDSSWTSLTGKPTTIAGYGITDAVNTIDNQTIAGNKTFIGIISAGNHIITNVAAPLNNTDVANKAYVDFLIEQIDNELLDAGLNGVVKDIDGNTYKTIKIGTQIWMVENLKVTHYLNGELIPKITDNTDWSNLTTGARCYYNNDSATYNGTYGALYNWESVNTDNICPTGWHIPNNDEWISLASYLGGYNVAGGKLKETGIIHWMTPNAGATNETGFTALPGGSRLYDGGTFFNNGQYGYFWTSTEVTTSQAYYWYVFYQESILGGGSGLNKNFGCSVRCLRY